MAENVIERSEEDDNRGGKKFPWVWGWENEGFDGKGKEIGIDESMVGGHCA